MAADLPLLLSEITRAEAREVAARALVVLPTGATEQHGPHLPVGTDSLAVEAVARGAAARAGSSPDTENFVGTWSRTGPPKIR